MAFLTMPALSLDTTFGKINFIETESQKPKSKQLSPAFSRTDHNSGHKTNLNQFEKTEIAALDTNTTALGRIPPKAEGRPEGGDDAHLAHPDSPVPEHTRISSPLPEATNCCHCHV